MKEALAIFASVFGHIVIVTNQRGVGRGLMTEAAGGSSTIGMVAEILLAGGRMDHIYFADSLDNDHPHRKPNPGMAFAAQADFPAIDFSRALMVGNNISNMEFGRNAGMYTVYLTTTQPDQSLPHPALTCFQFIVRFCETFAFQ